MNNSIWDEVSMRELCFNKRLSQSNNISNEAWFRVQGDVLEKVGTPVFTRVAWFVYNEVEEYGRE